MKENLLYCENSNNSWRFLESECKVHFAFIRLFTELGVLNFQSCKRVENEEKNTVRHLVARTMHEQENWPIIGDCVWLSRSVKWQRILEREGSYRLSSLFFKERYLRPWQCIEVSTAVQCMKPRDLSKPSPQVPTVLVLFPSHLLSV